MKELIVLKELNQIKAIASLYRIEILECFNDNNPKTVKEIAEYMNEPHSKVNYHVKILQKAQILELVKERPRAGIVEKFFLPTAKTFIIDKKLSRQNENDEKNIDLSKNISKAHHSIIEKINRDLNNNLENNRGVFSVNRTGECFLTYDEAKEIIDIVDEKLSNLIKSKKERKDENAKLYNFALFAYEHEKVKVEKKKLGCEKLEV